MGIESVERRNDLKVEENPKKAFGKIKEDIDVGQWESTGVIASMQPTSSWGQALLIILKGILGLFRRSRPRSAKFFLANGSAGFLVE